MIITQVIVKCMSMIIFFNAQKSIVSNPKATFNGTTVTSYLKCQLDIYMGLEIIWSVEWKTCSMQCRTEPSGVNLLKT